MLTTCDDPNTQKQLRRSEQIKKWNEREKLNMNSGDIRSQMIINDQKEKNFQRTIKVRFPKGCVFLAACSSGDSDEVKTYLKIGVNINTTNIDGLTALHQACIDANIEMVRFLVENNADINSQDNEGWTPLHAAVSVGNLDVSKYLINKGARLNICNNDSDLPIDLCDSLNNQMKDFLDDEMQSQSIDADYERRKEELIMFEDAKKMRFEDKVQGKTGATALHVSAAKGYIRVMKILIQSGANVNAVDKDGWTPLHAAAHWEQEEACKILCENGADFSIKTYSDQSIFDVCDTEMVSKLKQLETNSKTNNDKDNKLTDVTSINNQFKVTDSSRNRKVSDELSKPSINLLKNNISNETQKSIENSSITKKQQDILLSPITTPTTNNNDNMNLKNNNFDFNNSESENVNKSTESTEETQNRNTNNTPNSNVQNTNGIDHLTFNDKENRNIINNLTQSVSTNGVLNGAATQSIMTTPLEQTSRQKSNNKSSLHENLKENLKSLSAQVRMMEEDKEDLLLNNEKNTQKLNKRTETPLLPKNSPPPPQNILTSPPPQVSTTITLNNPNKNTPKSSYSNNSSSDQLTNVVGSPNNQADNRRYSTMPVASKDEQAELIRKQKAKLERHFRRSTTAVSYEDIKSAEATIKGTGSNTNLFQKADSTISEGLTEQKNNFNQSLPISSSTNLSASLASSVIPNGVSSLSSLFGEPMKSSCSNYSNSHNSSISVNLNPSVVSAPTPVVSAPTINLQISTPPNATSSSYLSIDSSSPNHSNTHTIESTLKQTESINGSSQNSQNSQNNTHYNSNKDNENNAHLIENDIETDKLLNVIEKSKGFSDSKSTTAMRRNRNKGVVIQMKNISDTDLSNSAKSKVQSLRWNEEKLELEVVKKEQAELLEKQNRENNLSNMSPNTSNKVISPSSLVLKRQLSGPNLESSNLNEATNLGITSNNTNNTNSSRPTFRFGQNDGQNNLNTNTMYTPNIPNTNSQGLNRTNIKRSVSQANTDRRPLSATNSSPPLKSFNNIDCIDNSKLPFDYQAAYGLMKKENDSLNHTILRLNKELEESSKEKRAFDRRISELEEEVKKVDNLKQDNIRLKDENAALIRVISKLSK